METLLKIHQASGQTEGPHQENRHLRAVDWIPRAVDPGTTAARDALCRELLDPRSSPVFGRHIRESRASSHSWRCVGFAVFCLQ